MPSYQLTKEWSSPIPKLRLATMPRIKAYEVMIAVEPASIDDALVIPKREAILIENATNIRASYRTGKRRYYHRKGVLTLFSTDTLFVGKRFRRSRSNARVTIVPTEGVAFSSHSSWRSPRV